jgi:two-component system cell cycle response regulator
MPQSGELSPTPALKAYATALTASRAALGAHERDALESVRRIAGRIKEAAERLGLATAAGLADRLTLATEDDAAQLIDQLGAELRSAFISESGNADTVLLVEDDKVTAAIIREMLTTEGRIVHVAATGASARQLVAEESISLILLDLVLPDMDGRNLLLQFRAAGRTSGIPIVVLTSKTDSLTHSECLCLGADGFLTKPVARDVLNASVAGVLARTRQIGQDARRDALTGLPNRAAFEEALQRAASHAFRHDHPLSVALVDLDHFKTVNDTFGHDMGDEVLRRAAAVLRDSLRLSDLVARWGGEEFCALLPGTSPAGALHALKKALANVRNETFAASDGRVFGVTFSSGVAPVLDRSAPEKALGEADRLMYLAKTTGRNRVLSDDGRKAPPKPRILLAEDDAAVADLVKKRLAADGFDVVHAADGGSALESAKQQNFSVIILDRSMPVLDGFEVLRRLRTLPQFALVPIIMLTGAADESDVMEGFRLGATDYVTKPFYAAELSARIVRLVQRR